MSNRTAARAALAESHLANVPAYQASCFMDGYVDAMEGYPKEHLSGQSEKENAAYDAGYARALRSL
jgi:hypothetical protein